MSFFDDADQAIERQKEADAKAGDAENWSPEEGDVLRGKVLDAKYLNLTHGWAPLLIVEDQVVKNEKTGELQIWKVWGTRSVLKGEILDSQPSQGSLIVITYEGKQTAAKSGNSFHLYIVRAESADPAFWNRLTAGKHGPSGERPTVGDDDLPDPFA